MYKKSGTLGYTSGTLGYTSGTLGYTLGTLGNTSGTLWVVLGSVKGPIHWFYKSKILRKEISQRLLLRIIKISTTPLGTVPSTSNADQFEFKSMVDSGTYGSTYYKFQVPSPYVTPKPSGGVPSEKNPLQRSCNL